MGESGGDGSTFCLSAPLPSVPSVLGLFAVGYFIPSNNDEWGAPPEDRNFPTNQDIVDAVLRPYRDWLRERRDQETPATVATEIWTDFDGPTKGDPFHEWPGT